MRESHHEGSGQETILEVAQVEVPLYTLPLHTQHQTFDCDHNLDRVFL